MANLKWDRPFTNNGLKFQCQAWMKCQVWGKELLKCIKFRRVIFMGWEQSQISLQKLQSVSLSNLSFICICLCCLVRWYFWPEFLQPPVAECAFPFNEVVNQCFARVSLSCNVTLSAGLKRLLNQGARFVWNCNTMVSIINALLISS